MRETGERLRVPESVYRVLAPEIWPDRMWATPEPFARSANGKIMRGEVAAAVDPGRVVLLKGGSDE
ncbi:hypothetical protein [Streptomyces sp. NPDC093568]|uniref:hypothetical protein n=1 Tax=Streptomyces sp. NPDC093568 TaxID=3366041 RepID=UPI00380F0C88